MRNATGTVAERSKRDARAVTHQAAAGARRAKNAKNANGTKGASGPSSATATATPPKRGRDPLLSAICHDLRAPLAAVTMGANFVLQTTARDDANARSVKILEAMLRSCGQMERLIRNFADLSEIEGNALTLRLGLHDAGEMIELTATSVREAATQRSVTVEIHKPEPPISMTCDRERLLRALSHIADNAVKHAPEGSTVTLSVIKRNDDVCFAVVDRGPGLSPQVRRNLYDRHWHAKRANRVGAGFGLAIARGFVTAHDGRLLVESRPGVETTFTACVPTAGPRTP